jgi:hypothetical protein
MSACLSVCHDAASVVLQGVVGVVLPLTISLTLMAAAHLSSVMELRHFCTPLGEDTLPRACLTRWPWAPKGAVAGAHGCRAWFESMNANLCMILSSGSLDPFDVFDHQVPQSVLAYYLVCGAGHSHTAASEKTAAHAIHPADASRVTRKACEQPLQLPKAKVQATTQSHAAELPVDRRMPVAMARGRAENPQPAALAASARSGRSVGEHPRHQQLRGICSPQSCASLCQADSRSTIGSLP